MSSLVTDIYQKMKALTPEALMQGGRIQLYFFYQKKNYHIVILSIRVP